jgi:SAM-dependent methyltransferase
MAEATPTESLDEIHKKLAHYVETKRYIEEPEVLPWYKKNLDEIKPRTRELFEKYSHIAPAEVENHIHKTVSMPLSCRDLQNITQEQRDEAFKVFPYPCVGNWGFLNLSVVDSPLYDEVVERVSRGEQYLDIGCCMGQDIRKLAYDGAPQENMYGSDLKKEFWDIGYNLFLDQSQLKAKFIEADVFDADSALKELDGKLNIVHAASFFHLWDWDEQVQAAKRVVRLLKAEPGVMIFGRQGGMPEAGKISHLVQKELNSYWHNPESWAKLWKQVGDETDSQWEVVAALGEEDLTKRMNAKIVPAGTRFMTFSIRRL